MPVRKIPSSPPKGFDFDRSQAAAYLGLTVAALNHWAMKKTHLPFVIAANKAWYRKSDLDALLRHRTVTVKVA